MGKLTGNAVTLDGEIIKVTFEGEGVADGILAHIVSINTQMDGGGEYSPLKITTASVSCLVDGAELMRLCVNEQPVSVIIENVDQESILFKGYVVPNSYNQALSGINDTITIECVDCLGWAKYMLYHTNEGFAVVTLSEVFRRASIELGFAEVRIANDVKLKAVGGALSANYDQLSLSENAFLHEIYPQYVGNSTISYGPVAMTWEEVLSMIAESLRLTWVQVGGIAYLADEVRIADDVRAAYYRNELGFAGADGVEHEVVESDFAATDCNVSTLPHWQQVVLSHEQRDVVKVLPELFCKEYMTPTGDEIEYKEIEDGYVARRKVYTPIYDTSNSYLYAYKKYEDPNNRPKYDGSWEFYQRIGPIYDGLPEVFTVLRARVAYRGAVAPVVGNRMRVKLTIGQGEPWNDEKFQYEEDSLYLRLSATRDGVKKYYNAQTKSWQIDQVDNKLIFTTDGEQYRFERVIGNDIVIGEGGTIDAEIVVKNSAWSYFIFIKDFSVEVVLSPIEELKKKEYKGVWSLKRTQEVSLPMDIATGGFGNLISNKWYTEIVVGGMSVLDRVWAQANLGDRLMWEMALRDEANGITALDAFTCAQLWNGRKVVAGYTRDVLDNTITLTLI